VWLSAADKSNVYFTLRLCARRSIKIISRANTAAAAVPQPIMDRRRVVIAGAFIFYIGTRSVYITTRVVCGCGWVAGCRVYHRT